jgi:hypothetical protein
MRIGATIGLGILGLMVAILQLNHPSNCSCGLVVVLCCYNLPVLLLRSKISRRQQEIRRHYLMRWLLVICVEAGLGFDSGDGC